MDRKLQNIALILSVACFVAGGVLLMNGGSAGVNRQGYGDDSASVEVIWHERNPRLGNAIPQYKDENGICGIAKNKVGDMKAVASEGDCLSPQELRERYGLEYTMTADMYRPKASGGECGTAHLIREGARIGSKDMSKLSVMARGNLNEVPIKAYEGKCPLPAELSDMVSNSIGVPVRFGYNSFDINEEHYPVVTVSVEESFEGVEEENIRDKPIYEKYSDKEVYSNNGKRIPQILMTRESLDMCDGDYGKCFFNDKDMSLQNNEEEKDYRIWTHNGYALPKGMMTKGALETCNGTFPKCDFIPDSEGGMGTLVNLETNEKYHPQAGFDIEGA